MLLTVHMYHLIDQKTGKRDILNTINVSLIPDCNRKSDMSGITSTGKLGLV